MKSKVLTMCLGLALLVAISGCESTSPTGGAEPAGFLGDYSMLKPGEKDQAQLDYFNPDADFSKYRKIKIDPVTFWTSPGSDLKDVSVEDRRHLASHLAHAVRRALSPDYELVGEPGPDVMRLRLAFTEAKGSKVLLDTVTTVLPVGRAISGIKKLATGTHSFVGQAGLEAELVDSMTGERLGAAVDERAGAKTVKGVTSTWNDVISACDLWAGRLATRLAELRAR